MKVKLKLFFKWGIKFDEENPFSVADKGNRKVKYADRREIIDGIVIKYRPELLEPPAPENKDTQDGGRQHQMKKRNRPQQKDKRKSKGVRTPASDMANEQGGGSNGQA